MSEKYELTGQDTGKVKEEAKPVAHYRTLLPETTYGSALEDLIDFRDSSSDVSENALNRKRLRQFKENYTKELLRTIREQDFEYGFDSEADLFVRGLMKQNEAITKQWLNEIYLEHFHDLRVFIGLLQVISHLQYPEIYPQGPTMALAALSHDNSEVRECGIRAFENWSTIDSLNILRNVKCEEIWLKEYLTQVIRDLEEEF